MVNYELDPRAYVSEAILSLEGVVSVSEYFADEYDKGLNIILDGLESLNVAALSDAEAKDIVKVAVYYAEHMRKVSPELADLFVAHIPVFLKAAKWFKRICDRKAIRWKPGTNDIGISVLIPQLFKPVATPDATNPYYTDYKNNVWEIDLTAGTAKYIMGDGTNFYKSTTTEGSRIMCIIIQDGLLSIGDRPVIQQQMAWTSRTDKSVFPVIPTHPLIELPIDKDRSLYQYNTPGVFITQTELGYMWKILPCYDMPSAKLPLLGFAFFERGVLADTKWVS